MRLNKYLAAVGLASRREADALIAAGRVCVNDRIVTEMGVAVDPAVDRVVVNGKPVFPERVLQYLIMNKPPGYLTTVRDPFHRPTVMDLLPELKSRIYPVGRLDLDTSGLLFFTNDGELAQALTHPAHLVKKTYRVTVSGLPSREKLTQLKEGVVLEDGVTAPAIVKIEAVKKGNAILELTINEGRKRQVKRMFQAIGHPVLALQRLQIGPLTLGGLALGKTRRPSPEELRELLKLKNTMIDNS